MVESPPEALCSFHGCMKPIHCILPVLKEFNELIYVGTNSGDIHVWDLKLKREKSVHNIGNEACLNILFHNDSFITQQKGSSIKFWNENCDGTWKLIKILNHDYYGFCRMALFNDFIYLPCDGSSIISYDFVKNKEIIKVGENHLGDIMCLTVINSINSIMVCYEAGEIILWSLEWKILTKIKISDDCPMALDYCSLTNEGVIGTNSDKVFKFQLNMENKVITVVREAILTNPGVSSVAINREGKLCVLGCWDSRIRYYSMKKMKLLAVLTHHTGSIDSIIFINEELSFCAPGLVVAGGKDSRVSLWTLYTNLGKCIVNKK